MTRTGWVAAVAGLATVAGGALAASGVKVSLVPGGSTAITGRPWTARLDVRPASFGGALRVTAVGPTRIDVRASGGHDSYRVRLVFPAAGRWTLTARAGGATARLGSVRVIPARPTPLAFVWPTSVDVQPDGTLLLVENGLDRLLRVDPASGTETVIAALTKPYAVERAPSGSIFVTDGPRLLRIDGAGPPVTVAEAGGDIGPIAIGPGGDVYFTTEAAAFELPGGSGPARLVAAQLSNPHGLAVAADGAILVADTGHHEIRRIDPRTGAITTFARMAIPRGMAVAADGTVYVADGGTDRVLHLDPSGDELGAVGLTYDDPYDVGVAPDGAVYVVESLAVGHVRRVAPDGTVTTLSRRPQ